MELGKVLLKTVPLVVSVLMLGSGCCRSSEDFPMCGSLICHPVIDGMAVTKSQFTGRDDMVTTAEVGIYDGQERLVLSEYYTDCSAMVFSGLRIGETYHVYAAFNVGEVDFPEQEEDIGWMDYTGTMDEWQACGLPMCWHGEVTVNTDGQVLEMDAERLVCRITFRIDDSGLSDHSGSFTVSSIALKNAVQDVCLFDERQLLRGDLGYSSDWSSSSDIYAVNSGGRSSFYAFENICGTLLPDNTDPWGKVPDSIPGYENVCTYLEVTGRYSTDSASCSGPVTYRMYLGEDATTNFDLVRNCVYDVTLAPSDEGLRRTSWKVSAGTFSDERSMVFIPQSIIMDMGGSTVFKVSTAPSLFSYSLNCGAGYLDAGLSLSATDTYGVYRLTSDRQLRDDAETSVVASSWDGRVVSVLPVTVRAGCPVSLTVSLSLGSIIPSGVSEVSAAVTYSDGTVEDVSASATFISGSLSYASVEGRTVTGISPGDVYIVGRYTANGVTVTGKTKLHVYRVTRGLEITDHPERFMDKSENWQMQAVLFTCYDGVRQPEQALTVTDDCEWSSSDPSCVSMSYENMGMAFGTGYGSAEISAAYSGMTAGCHTATSEVTVARPALEMLDITSHPNLVTYADSNVTVHLEVMACSRKWAGGQMWEDVSTDSYACFSSSGGTASSSLIYDIFPEVDRRYRLGMVTGNISFASGADIWRRVIYRNDDKYYAGTSAEGVAVVHIE